MSIPIHLPLDNNASCRVYVTPSKFYGKLTGSELIQIYGRRVLKQIETKSIEQTKNSIFIPSGFLDNRSLEILKQLERITDTKILHSKQPRAIRNYMNTTLVF